VPGRRPTIAAVLLLAFVTTVALALEQPVLTIPGTAGTECVEATSFMRKQHMKLLLIQRDQTVQQGNRSGNHSLRKCVDCHANRDETGQAIPVTDSDQFCASCHQYAGVRMDCFECHATVPDE